MRSRVQPCKPPEIVFDGIPLCVSPGAVMTPASTTVALVDVATEWIGTEPVTVADVGTGTGAIAISVAQRAPRARIWAIDDSEAAVFVARANVARYRLDDRVTVLLGNLLEPAPDRFDIVLANLPYHAEARSRGPDETANRDQPEHAIYAHGDGLQLLRNLIQACRTRLDEQGCLVIQLYGSILSAGRDELDALLQEIEIRAAEGWEARAAADAAGTGRRRSPWQASPRSSSGRSRRVARR